MQQKFQSGYKHKVWFKEEINGTEKELMEAFEVSSKYLYKLLDFAESNDPIPEGDLERERKIFSFCMQGPKAGHFRFDKREKLTSADVLYFLSSSLPSTKIAARFGVNRRCVDEIRRGLNPAWYWEYMFVRRLKAILKGRIYQADKVRRQGIYSVSKVNDDLSKEILVYTTSKRKAVNIRESLITKGVYKKLKETETLDIMYPIEQIDVLV